MVERRRQPDPSPTNERPLGGETEKSRFAGPSQWRSGVRLRGRAPDLVCRAGVVRPVPASHPLQRDDPVGLRQGAGRRRRRPHRDGAGAARVAGGRRASPGARWLSPDRPPAATVLSVAGAADRPDRQLLADPVHHGHRRARPPLRHRVPVPLYCRHCRRAHGLTPRPPSHLLVGGSPDFWRDDDPPGNIINSAIRIAIRSLAWRTGRIVCSARLLCSSRSFVCLATG